MRITARRDGDDVEIAVEDDGPGIAPDDVERVLHRFARAGDPNERTRGMGIGLSLANEILVAHGSTMQVASRLGDGARFAFVLPAATRASEAEAPVSR